MLDQKHSENVHYYDEIKRLTDLVNKIPARCEQCPEWAKQVEELRVEESKLKDQNNFLREKADILSTTLATEQSNQKLANEERLEVVEKNAALRKDLERLTSHLLEVEEVHTKETLEMQQELETLRQEKVVMKEQLSQSNTAFTSAR